MPRKKSQPIDTSWTEQPEAVTEEPVVEVAMDVEPDMEPEEEVQTTKEPEQDMFSPKIFRTRDQEATAFMIRCGPAKVRGGRNVHDGFVYWRVPAELVDVFKNTPHVLSGRIVEAD